MIRWARALVVALGLLGCGQGDRAPASAPEASPASPKPAAVAPVEALEWTAARPAEEPDADAVTLIASMPTPEQGPLDEVLMTEVAKARAEGRRVYVELWASWCPRCKKLDAVLSGPELGPRLGEVHLVRLDTDRWGDELDARGFTARTIPTLYAVDPRGRPTQRRLNAHGWSKLSAAEVARRLAAFFAD